MRTFEYNQFPDIYLPYLVSPDNPFRARLDFLLEAVVFSRLPLLSRWVIYQSLKRY